MNAELLEAVRPAAERVGWVLVHSTWEGLVVAAGLWVVLVGIGRGAVRARYAACCAALAAIVVAMGVTFVWVGGVPRVAGAVGVVSGRPVGVDWGSVDVSIPAAVGVEPARVERRPVERSWDVRGSIEPWLPGVVGVWGIGVVGLAVWHLGGWMRVRRMARGAGGAGEWEECVGRIAARLGVKRGVRVVESALAGVPAVVGFVRPVILLPVGMAAEMSVGQVEAILAHELAHVRRNDYLVNLVQTVVETLLFYHPAVWWISGRIRQEREHCCDDLAVAACGGDRAGYAGALARVEEVRGGRPALAMAADGGSLLGRVRRLAGVEARGGRRASSLAAVVLAVACAAGVIALAEWPARAAGGKKVAATSHPATVQEVPKGQVGVRVTDPSGRVVDIEDIREIAMFLPQGEGKEPMRWIMGPKPEVLERLPDGGVTVGKEMFAAANFGKGYRGKQVEMTFDVGGGVAMVATGTFEAGKVLQLRTLGTRAQLAVDVTDGPADVAADEVAGRVVDEEGNPLGGAVVSVPNGPPPFPQIVAPVTTGADGVFRFPHFGGHYLYFQVDKAGYDRRWLMDVPVGRGFTVQVSKSTGVKGRLVLSDGKPAGGATITLKTSKRTIRPQMFIPIPVQVETKTDADGRYNLPVEPGEYEALISSPGGETAHVEHVAVPTGRTVALPEKLEPGARLRVRTVDNATGEPVSGVGLAIEQSGAGWARPQPGTIRKTGADGRTASWDGLVPGQVRVEVHKEGYARWWAGEKKREEWDRWIDAVVVDVKAGMPEVTIRMEKGVTVTGRVGAWDGTPVDGAEVNIAGLWTGDARYMVRADKEGRFKMMFPASLGKAGEGSFVTLVAHDLKWRYGNAVSHQVHVTPGMSEVIDLTAPPGGHVVGRVVDAGGRPVAKVEIEATATDGVDTVYFSPRALTNAEGRFDVGPIRPGVYRVRPDTTYGINQSSDPQGDVKLLEVKNQQIADVGDIRYTGPKPSLTPEREAELMREVGHGPAVPGGAVSRRPVGGSGAPATRAAGGGR